MKIVIIGATGTIGSAVVNAFEAQHQVIKVGHSSGDYQMNIADPASIKFTLAAIYQQHGNIDALISTTGKVSFNLFNDINDQGWALGIENKLMGQINLVRYAQEYLTTGASITLTTGILSEEHILTGVSAAAMNGAINAFVTAVAPVLPNGLRINAISPTLLEESVAIYQDYFPGFVPVSAKKVAQAYVRSVLGINNGKIMKVA